jgi:RNA polymerase sigma factor (sigma-70 family)
MEDLKQMGKPMRELHDHFANITEPVRPALWRYCLRLTGNAWDAEDLVQETLIKAFGRLRHYWQPLDAKSYLFRIATNAWIDLQRKGRLPTSDLDEVGEPASAEVDPGERWAAMEALVAALPPRQRVVLLLIDVFDFTAGEVAAMIGSTEGAVKAALHRARTLLRQQGAAAAPRNPKPAPSPLVQRFMDAFDRRDPDGIAALCFVDASCDIVGVAEELGLAEMRKNSLRETFLLPAPMRTIFGLVDGEGVVGVLVETAPGDWRLDRVIRIEEVDGRLMRMRCYFFTPELIEHAAAQLGVPAITNGYRYISQ